MDNTGKPETVADLMKCTFAKAFRIKPMFDDSYWLEIDVVPYTTGVERTEVFYIEDYEIALLKKAITKVDWRKMYHDKAEEVSRLEAKIAKLYEDNRAY